MSVAYCDSNYQSSNSQDHFVFISDQPSHQPTTASLGQKSDILSMHDYIVYYSKDTVIAHFQENNFRLTHNPVVCTTEEDNGDTTGRLDLATQTWYAILDWSTKLNEGHGKNGPWHISYKKYPHTTEKFDPQCNVIVRFYNSASTDDHYFVGIKSGGVTYYDFSQHRVYIKILYDDALLPKIQGVIKHELGHAWGLGHYITSEPQLERVALGLEDSPSIMIGVVPGSNHYEITALDIEELKNKYASDSFQNDIVYHEPSISQKYFVSQNQLKEHVKSSTQNNLDSNNPGNNFLPLMIHDDASDGTGFVGTGSVLVKDLIVGGYLKIPPSIDKNQLTYELPLSVRYHVVHTWANGDMIDGEFINSLQNMINSGKLDLTKHYQEYEN